MLYPVLSHLAKCRDLRIKSAPQVPKIEGGGFSQFRQCPYLDRFFLKGFLKGLSVFQAKDLNASSDPYSLLVQYKHSNYWINTRLVAANLNGNRSQKNQTRTGISQFMCFSQESSPMLRITRWFYTGVSHARKPWNMVEVLGDLWDRKQHEVALWCLVFCIDACTSSVIISYYIHSRATPVTNHI